MLTKKWDVLVNIKAVGLNPVDVKLTKKLKADVDLSDSIKNGVLGYDGAGVIAEVGELAKSLNFSVGDEVFFASPFTRGGTYAEYMLVDARIIAKKPKALSFEEAAAVPLVALTGWNGLITNMKLDYELQKLAKEKPGQMRYLLLLPGAGGTGSLALQLASKYLNKHGNLVIIASASRPESAEHCLELGAHLTVNPRENMKEQFAKMAVDPKNEKYFPKTQIGAEEEGYFKAGRFLNFVYYGMLPELYETALYECLVPFGHIARYVEGNYQHTAQVFMPALTISSVFMFARMNNEAAGTDMREDGQILEKFRQMIDGEMIDGENFDLNVFRKRFMGKVVEGPMDAQKVIENHKEQEGGKMMGKIAFTF